MAAAIRAARWRYLLRDPAFQRDVNELRQCLDWRNVKDAWHGRALQARAERISKAWTEKGVYLPTYRSILQALPDIGPSTLAKWEALLHSDDADGVPIGDAVEFSVSSDVEEEFPGPPGRYLNISIDLERPLAVDVTLALIEERLRSALSKDSGKRRRHRADSTDFQLAVYDQVVEGQSFGTIAAQLGRPVSTVKSAFRVAWWRVFGSNPPPKKRASLVGFDPSRHIEQCARAAAP